MKEKNKKKSSSIHPFIHPSIMTIIDFQQAGDLNLTGWKEKKTFHIFQISRLKFDFKYAQQKEFWKEKKKPEAFPVDLYPTDFSKNPITFDEILRHGQAKIRVME